MSIRSYFERKDSLPDPKGLLSSRLPSQAIAFDIQKVEKVTTSEKGKKRCQYSWITDNQLSEWRWPDDGVDDKRSVLLDRRFFLSCIQKLYEINFRSSSFATKKFSLEILPHEILQHENFPIYGSQVWE